MRTEIFALSRYPRTTLQRDVATIKTATIGFFLELPGRLLWNVYPQNCMRRIPPSLLLSCCLEISWLIFYPSTRSKGGLLLTPRRSWRKIPPMIQQYTTIISPPPYRTNLKVVLLIVIKPFLWFLYAPYSLTSLADINSNTLTRSEVILGASGPSFVPSLCARF